MIEFFQNLKFACWWDVPVLILLIALTAWFFVKKQKLKKEEEKLNSQLSN